MRGKGMRRCIVHQDDVTGIPDDLDALAINDDISPQFVQSRRRLQEVGGAPEAGHGLLECVMRSGVEDRVPGKAPANVREEHAEEQRVVARLAADGNVQIVNLPLEMPMRIGNKRVDRGLRGNEPSKAIVRATKATVARELMAHIVN